MSNPNRVTKTCGVFLLWALAAIALPAQTFTTLHSFDLTDGYAPQSPLVQATDGNFYGTTSGGGTYFNGTIFRISPSGTLTTIYNFCVVLQNGICLDGSGPLGGLVLAPNGELYGTTADGGTHFNDGTVFKITPEGTLTTLYNFCSVFQQGKCVDGTNPFATLILGAGGNLYGTTRYGGTDEGGTAFKITTNGVLTTLYSFCQVYINGFCADGYAPVGTLLQASDGDLYGTTSGGGLNCPNGCGTIFKLTLSGTLTTLYTFCAQTNCTDGSNPFGGLIHASNGDLYGTTGYGGANDSCGRGCGTVFKLTPSGTLITVASFDSTNGYLPTSGLIRGTDGNYYGTTELGGSIYKIAPTGVLTTLHVFTGYDGYYPVAGLIQGTDGSFYGTTTGGGPYDDGTVYNLSVGLKPFVETQPPSGATGALVKILGTNLTGATSVTFNGTPATFAVKSRTLIVATVPSGATSGTVQVAALGGTLSSNTIFRVRP